MSGYSGTPLARKLGIKEGATIATAGTVPDDLADLLAPLPPSVRWKRDIRPPLDLVMVFFGAPHVAIVSSDEALGTHGVMDTGAWVANFMLVGTALGVASIAQAALASYPEILRKHLDIATDRRIVCGISFGFEDTAHPANGFRTSRAPLEEVVTWVG